MLLIYRVCSEKTPWLQSNADNIQGVLGEGTLGYKITLSIYRVCLEIRHPGFLVWSLAGHGDQDRCAYVLSTRADILLEIPRVHISK